MTNQSKNPLLSVIIPAYNAADFIPKAVSSIRQQTFLPPTEIIIVDDGSTDNTADIVQQLESNIRYIYQENSSPAAARNRGLRAARGEMIAFLDADDLFPPHKFEIQVKRLQNDPSIDVIQGRIQYDHMEGAEDRSNPLDEDDAMTYIQIGAAIFRKSVFDRVGPFDEDLRFSEDHDIFMRLRENNVPLVIINDITLIYRLHAHNMTNNKTTYDFQLLQVLKKSIDRRKKAHGDKIRQLPRFLDYKEDIE